MQTEQIVALLIAERDRLSKAIDALTGSSRARSASPAAAAPKTGKRKLSAAGRRAIAEAAKRRWAAIRAGKAASPFAKVNKNKRAR